MTNEELNKAIAEALEPYPTTWYNDPDGCGIYKISEGNGWWKGNGYSQEPQQFSTNSKLTVWMMKEGGLAVEYWGDHWTAGNRWFNGMVSMLANRTESPDLERAVAEAFLAHLKAKEGR